MIFSAQPRRARRAFALLAALAIAAGASLPRAARADDSGTNGNSGDSDASTYAIGVGINRMPGWSGSKKSRNNTIPYFDIEIPNVGSLSTDNGLQVDFIRGSALHGGIYGNYEWGRARADMGPIAGKLPSLSPRFDGGGYLEWQVTKTIDVGTDLSHDLDGATWYWRMYAEWDLPAIGYLQHSFQFHWSALNGAGMRRLYGITPSQAAALGTSPWRPDAGPQQTSLEYDLFMPTSQHTGVAAALEYGHLLDNAEQSPLVRQFGTPWQPSVTLAFIYHF